MAVFLVDPYSAGCACSREKCSDDCSFYRKYKPKPKPITHFDEIKAMSVEEFAGWIAEHIDCFNCPNPRNGCSENDETCAAAWLDWLMEEEK